MQSYLRFDIPTLDYVLGIIKRMSSGAEGMPKCEFKKGVTSTLDCLDAIIRDLIQYHGVNKDENILGEHVSCQGREGKTVEKELRTTDIMPQV